MASKEALSKVLSERMPVKVPHLTERQRTIANLVHGGMTRADVARHLGTSKMNIYNAVRNLKDQGRWPSGPVPEPDPDGIEVRTGNVGRIGDSTGAISANFARDGTPQVQLRGVGTVSGMISALQSVLAASGDLPCLIRDSVGVYSKVSPLVIKDLESWDVLGAFDLPPGVGSGSRVVVWE